MRTKTFVCCAWLMSSAIWTYGGVVVAGGEKSNAQLPADPGEFGVLTWCAIGVVAVSWLFPKLLNK